MQNQKSNQNQPVQPAGKPQEIRIQDNFAGGEYANAMQIVHNKEEFVLTFMNILPPAGRVCGKIITNPGHLKRMIAALQDNLAKYENQFGKVEEAQAPQESREVGFSAK